ncbi:MAG: DNA-processing protein DprA [bacterium]|nr:DNA-processing protein DprA [bacterium]
MTPEDLLGPLNEVEQKNAPKQLFASGRLSLLAEGRRVSVVGSRNASDDALARARFFSSALVEHGITVVSGLALGIDAVAHETAISAGGSTIGVLGTPLDQYYPKENRSLQERMMQEQLVVSQFAPGTPGGRKNFPMRNRTMALITDATVIVEAGEKSGTLHQGWEALRLGRLLFLMESVANNPNLTWPSEMIRYGAQVLSRGNLELVLDEMPEFPRGESASL